jgi:transposase
MLTRPDRTHTAAAPEQFMEENGMIRAPHPRYSPDLTPSDFYLFGYVKHCLRGQSFETADELFSSIEAVLRGIEKST